MVMDTVVFVQCSHTLPVVLHPYRLAVITKGAFVALHDDVMMPFYPVTLFFVAWLRSATSLGASRASHVRSRLRRTTGFDSQMSYRSDYDEEGAAMLAALREEPEQAGTSHPKYVTRPYT